MRLLKEVIDKRDGSGSVTLLPEDHEDMWAAYNLIRNGDLLRASAIRRVTTESATGTTNSQRIHMTLTIRVTGTFFDVSKSMLAVSGRIDEETAYTKKGQYHTLDLELQRQFTIEKKEGWDSVSTAIVADAINVHKGAAAYAVVMQEGFANIAILTGERTVLRQRVESSVSGKAKGASAHDKGMERFFKTLLDTMLRNIDLNLKLPVLLASPGFTATSFQKYIVAEAVRRDDKLLQSQKDKFLVVHSSSGHLHALKEVLQSPEVLSQLKDTKFARETRLMDDFFEMLRKDDGRAWYGPKEVEKAVSAGAVGQGGGVLLINNSLFRNQDVEIRRRWVSLVDRVKDIEKGEVRILSSEHESGKRLEGLSGIAAILTFPLDLDNLEDDEADAPIQREAPVVDLEEMTRDLGL